ncbi:MAG: trypsin-like serine protease [Gaiellaceae bacterium]
MRHSLLLFCTSLALLVPGSAVAVTNGIPDGSGHPNVGALVVDLPGSGLTVVCSGTLIAPKVFLTAGHCTAGLTGPVYVTFATTLDRSSWILIPGTPVTAPGFGHDRSDPRDLGVVLLSSAPVGLTPAQLATSNTAELLNGGAVTNVGYGYYERQTGSGQPRFLYDGVRRASTSIVKNVTSSLIRTGSGVCFGDSGGPRFDGQTLVAVTSSGDAACAGMSTSYRIDTPVARAFLENFITLP